MKTQEIGAFYTAPISFLDRRTRKSMSEYVLEMIDINKSFPGVKALDHAQFKLRPGTIHSLVGENGAGKSTLMKCLFGIYIEDSGIIRIDDKQTKFETTKEALENGVSMVHQELNQVLKRNIIGNIQDFFHFMRNINDTDSFSF